VRYEEIRTELHAFLISLGGGLSLFYSNLWPLLICGILAFILMWWKRDRINNAPSASLGVANTITLGRLILLIIATVSYQYIDPLLYGIAILLVIIADGFDGYYARKFNEESAFGAVFDMETDAFLAAVLTTLIYMQMDIGIWLIGAGFLRYIFVIILRVLGLHKEDAPDMKGARLLAVLFFISLLLPFIFPLEFARWGLIVGAVLVYFSFGREFVLIAQKKLSSGR